MADKNKVFFECLAIDSARSFDENGYLHLAISPLTKETVNPYYGREIPNWQSLGLDPEKIYHGYRSGKELKKGLETFNGIPLLREHKLDSADKPLKDERVGFTGTSAEWKEPYIMNALTVADKEAIELIESGDKRELSASYQYKPVFESGYFKGEAYDFIMTEIRANHIALVERGRAGSDVLVYDKKPDTNMKYKDGRGEKMPKDVEKLRNALKILNEAFNDYLDEEAKEPAHSDYKDAMDKAGCDAESEQEQKAFAEGVKYGEELMRNPDERKKLDSEHESEGMKKAMDKAGCDAESEQEQKAFAEGVKYGEKLIRNPDERKKIDREHESEGAKKAMDNDDDKKDKSAGASDKFPFTQEDLKRAEERGAAKAVEKMKSLYNAANIVKRTVSVNPLAYDSAEDIYKEALKREGVDIAGVAPSAFAGLYKAVTKAKAADAPRITADDSKPDEKNAFVNNIKVED